MKNLKKIVPGLAVFLLLAGTARAQSFLEDPKWGSTLEERSQNVMYSNILQDANNQKDYGKAYQKGVERNFIGCFFARSAFYQRDHLVNK